MEQELYYQHCLSLAESFWAFPVSDIAEDQGIDSLDSYLLSIGVPRLSGTNKNKLRNRLDKYYSTQKKLRAIHIENHSNQGRHRAAVKIVGTAQLNFLQLIVSKISATLLPVAFSLCLSFLPQNMGSDHSYGEGNYFVPSGQSFYLSQGFIDEANKLFGNKDVVEPNPPQHSNAVSAPRNLRIVSP